MWADARVAFDKRAGRPEGGTKREPGRRLGLPAPPRSRASVHLAEDQGQGAKTPNATRVPPMSERGQQ